MLLTRHLALISFAVSAWGLTPPLSPHVRHESRRSLPADWSPVRRAEPDLTLPLRIGLVQPNLNDIESMLLDVSHPDSSNYGKHWSAAKVATTFRAPKESVSTVKEWLLTQGVAPSRIRLSKAGNWIEANVSIAQAEDLLKTEYYVYGHEATGAEHVACGTAYHLPEHVSKHVDLVTPTLHFDVKLSRDRPSIAKRDSKPGESGLGPVRLSTGGKLEVSRVFIFYTIRYADHISRTSSMSWKTAINISPRTACALSTISHMCRLRQKRTVSGSVRVTDPVLSGYA